MAPDSSAALKIAGADAPAPVASEWMPIGFVLNAPMSLVALHQALRKLRGKVTGVGRESDVNVRVELLDAQGKELVLPSGVARVRFVV